MNKLSGGIAIVILLFTVILIWFTFPHWMVHLFKISTDKDSQSLLGTFGDSFGALNTLFSGLAFSGIIISIYLQSKELSETRSEIKAQGTQFSLQTKALNKQVFENTFFQMLSLHNEILKGISINHGLEFSGRDAFDKLYGILKRQPNIKHSELLQLNSAYMEIYYKYQNEFGHYFRNLYNILKFVQNSEVEDKKLYTNLLRAQLSSNELIVLFYNGLSEMGNKKLKPLLEEFNFLKNLPKNLIFNEHAHVSFYSESAFFPSEYSA